MENTESTFENCEVHATNVRNLERFSQDLIFEVGRVRRAYDSYVMNEASKRTEKKSKHDKTLGAFDGVAIDAEILEGLEHINDAITYQLDYVRRVRDLNF